MKNLMSAADANPGATLAIVLLFLVVLLAICITIHETLTTVYAINAGLVEKEKLGTTGTYWTKPD